MVGGGIGGLATAASLARFDIPALVLERRDQPADGGLGINLPGNAITAKVVYDLPAGATIAVLELHDSGFSRGVKVRVDA